MRSEQHTHARAHPAGASESETDRIEEKQQTIGIEGKAKVVKHVPKQDEETRKKS